MPGYASPASQGTVIQSFCVPDMSLDCWQMHFPPWLVSWPPSVSLLRPSENISMRAFLHFSKGLENELRRLLFFPLIGQKCPGLCRHSLYCSECPLQAPLDHGPWADTSLHAGPAANHLLFNEACCHPAWLLPLQHIWLFWQC